MEQTAKTKTIKIVCIVLAAVIASTALAAGLFVYFNSNVYRFRMSVFTGEYNNSNQQHLDEAALYFYVQNADEQYNKYTTQYWCRFDGENAIISYYATEVGLVDVDDEVIGEEPDLLITATTISVTEVKELAEKYGGIAFPAHVDRPAHGILQMLGEIDETLGFTTVEVSKNASDELIRELEKRYTVVRDSDAHYLEDVNEEQVNFLELDELTPKSILEKLGQR